MDALMHYLRDQKRSSAWVPVERYRTEPVTLSALACGHTRTTLKTSYRFLGKRGLQVMCAKGCPGLQYLLSIGTIPATREGESCSGR